MYTIDLLTGRELLIDRKELELTLSSTFVPLTRTLNGLALSADQTFATGTTGTDFAITSSGSTHTFNIPDASVTARGLITTGTQSIAGAKTLTGNLAIVPTNSASTIISTIGASYVPTVTSGAVSAIDFSTSITTNALGSGMTYNGVRLVPVITMSGETLSTIYNLNNNIFIGGTGTLTNLAGQLVKVTYNDSTNITGSNFRSIWVSTPAFGTGATVNATSVVGFQVDSQDGYTGATNQYGMLIGSQTSATNSYSLYTNLGKARFGDSIWAVSGSAATPAYSFSSGTSDGFYRAGANIFAAVTNAVEIARFTTTTLVVNEGGLSTVNFRVEGDTDANLIITDPVNDRVGIGTSTPVSKLHISEATGAVLTLGRNDTAVIENDTMGILQFRGNDTQLTSKNIFGNIEVQSVATVTTDSPAGRMIFRTSGTTAGADPFERMRINQYGQVMIANEESLGSELIATGDFATNTGWTFGSGWTYDGTNFEADHATNGTGTLSYSPTIVVGKRYILTYEIKNRTAQGVIASCGGVTFETKSADGVYTHRFNALSTAGLVFTPSATGLRASIDNVSLKEITDGDLYVTDELHIGGGIYEMVQTKSADYTLTIHDRIVVFTATATATLPAATGSGLTFRIICRAGTLTIDANASETIKGELTQTLTAGEDLILSDTFVGGWE